ncbi:MAG: ATP-binding cassette domain-containing protein [Alphaproteobacteria bacterium]|nr:ATP-binding cassette domain-containing protein [Alphaproteobacteria bacterium]
MDPLMFYPAAWDAPLAAAPRTTTGPAPGLTLSGVSRQYRGVLAVDRVNLRVQPGEVHAVVGASAAGKSTLLRLAAGQEAPDHGTVHWSPSVPVGAGLGVLAPATGWAPRLTVSAVLQWRGAVSDSAQRLALDTVGLAGFGPRRVGELSSGQRQRVALAEVLVREPRVLIADDPAAGLDPASAGEVWSILRRLASDGGIAVLVASHSLAPLAGIADWVTVLDHGRVVDQAAPFHLITRPTSAVTRRLTSDLVTPPLPPAIQERLVEDASAASAVLLRLWFRGQGATAPVVSRLARALNVDVPIYAACVSPFGGPAFGTITVSVPNQPAVIVHAVGLLAELDTEATVLGYVSEPPVVTPAAA